MEGGWLARFRWRHRGAWLWPAFVALTLADAAIGHALPVSGDDEPVAAAALLALMLNLLAVLFLSRPLGALLRRTRRDLPVVVARNYAGTWVVAAVSAALLSVGAIHHHTVVANRTALRDAMARAEAWIGDHAPAAFQADAALLNTYAIEPGSVYRTCVPSADGPRTYCVIVKTNLPFARSVTYAGDEPNSVFAEGLW